MIKMKTNLLLLIATCLLLFAACDEEKETPNFDKMTIFTFEASLSSITQPESEIIVNYDEIIGYDPALYTFVFDDNAKTRIENNSGSTVAIGIDGEVIYVIKLTPSTSSFSYTDYLRIDPYSLNNRFKVELGYPEGMAEFTGEDLRNHERLIEFLRNDNKLITLE